MKKMLMAVIFCIVAINIYGQGYVKPVIVKRHVLITDNEKYDLVYRSNNGLNVTRHAYEEPKIKPEDWIRFTQYSSLRANMPVINNLIAQILSVNKNKLNLANVKDKLIIGMSFYIDSKNYKLIFADLFLKTDQIKDLTIIDDIEKGLMSLGDRVVIVPPNYNLPANIAAYGFTKSGATVAWHMIKDKVKLD